MHGSEHPRPDPQDWRQRAACRGMDPALFIPSKDSAATRLVAQAKAVCAGCPVIDDCRSTHADEETGIWFGTTPAERGFTPPAPDSHGTYAAYWRHKRRGEQPCLDCLAANAEQSRLDRLRKKRLAS